MKNNNISKKLIIIISSPSGAGKSSICKRLLKDDKYLRISVSDTTRPPRDNEVDGSRGSWTIQEGSDDLFLLNRLNGKKYKFNLTEV